ncbi:BlaI/MecI/CopY family transcriptional regulator [Caproiciproducens sp. NJN-50]|uniref:BlaI/MecI/CopY family transcriptional regulator n=1 Tax=Acutalibacteraceae TaxID=3082771 RepID=UPI000FFE04F0|nr:MULTISPECIES: BlaI/MecI/CopY family transcriptional regulator [Acutalibacteraceae]QAT50710.1 BlaI/MecI/CopY family transcriptional regulator [Caproiciproducens sp. NJN-50]
MRRFTRLPGTELKVMQAVWNCGGYPVATARVREMLEREKPWNVSALQTLLNRLIARGFLTSEKRGKNRCYTPLVGEEEYLADENRSVLEKLNGNSVTRLVASLYDSHSITEEDLEDLRAFLEERTAEP